MRTEVNPYTHDILGTLYVQKRLALDMSSKQVIGKKLRELRKKAGYKSHEAFAWDHDLNRQTVQRAEQGKNITLDTLINILRIHKISLKEFFKDID